MKHLKSIIAIILFITITFSVQAQEIILENSNLWKVEHPDLEKPSFIFGTLHMMCADDFEMPEKVLQAVASVDALVLEIDWSDPEEMKSMQASMTGNQKISEELSAAQFNNLDTLVQKILGTPLANLDAHGLAMVNMMLITKMLPCAEMKSFEAELIQIAKTEQMPIYGLETVNEQFAIVKEAYPTASSYQQMMLFDAYKKDFNNAIIAYNKEEINIATGYLTKPEYMDANATALMQVNRNKNWVEQMPQLMQEKSNLFAVGAAHLTNDFGIIHLLRQKGYTVSPVFN